MGKRSKKLKQFLVALSIGMNCLAVLLGAPFTARALPAIAATSIYTIAPGTQALPKLATGGNDTGMLHAREPGTCSIGSGPAKLSTNHSWLIDILDRSGSLGGPSGTDPQDFSVSVTKLLATLWGGPMEVIILNGDALRLTTLGPYDLSQGNNRTLLKQQIEGYRYRFGGDTPTQRAIEQAYQQLAQEQFPAGSQVMLITDGQPDIPQDTNGAAQIHAIEQTDAPRFASAGVAINTFGLQTGGNPTAHNFLQTVAQETGGCSYEVDNAKEMAGPVIQLYAQWQGLHFLQANHGTFQIDTYARQVDFITFLGNNQPGDVELIGPNQQIVPDSAFQDTDQDLHYQFNTLITQGFSDAGTYTVTTRNDPGALAYALVETGLRLTIVAPPANTPIYAGRPVTVSAAFYNDGESQLIHAHPAPGDVTSIVATYTITANGKVVEGGHVALQQQASPHEDLFSGRFTPLHTGTLTITVTAKYQYIPVPNTPSVTLQVVPAPVPLPPPCQPRDLACYAARYGKMALSIGIPALALLLLLALLLRPRPFGMLVDRQRDPHVLGQGRTLLARLLHPARLRSDEIPIDWDEASFVLRFKRGRRVVLTARTNTPAITIKRAETGETPQAPAGKRILLRNEDRILVNGQVKATFYTGVELS